MCKKTGVVLYVNELRRNPALWLQWILINFSLKFMVNPLLPRNADIIRPVRRRLVINLSQVIF